MIEAYKIILKENGSVRRAEELARKFRDEDGEERVQHRPKILVSKEIENWESTMQKTLGELANVKLRRSYRQTEIRIKLKGSLEQTQEALDKILSLARDNQ